MKILVFTDVHEKSKFIDILIKKAKNVDLLVCCGDLSWFGNSLENMIKKLLYEFGIEIKKTQDSFEEAMKFLNE